MTVICTFTSKMAAELDESLSSVESELDSLDSDSQSEDESYEQESEEASGDGEAAQRSRGRGRGRGRGRSRGRGHGGGGGRGAIQPPKPVWAEMILEPIVHAWQEDNGAVGPRIRTTIEMTPNDWFFVFMTPEMIEAIVRYTNRNAVHCGNNRWTKLTRREFEIWLGMTIAMGIHRLPSVELYWSNEWLYAIPQFKALMPRFRYQEIKSYLYFSEPGQVHNDQLGKIRFLLDQFFIQCREQFHLLRDMSIDEMMVKTKSKYNKCKIRNPQKPIRDGVKIEAMCDPRTGYVYTFHVHTTANADVLQVGSKTMNVVATLAAQLPFRGFNIYMDNYYSSVPLFRYLHNLGHNVIGTARLNRISPDLALKKSVPKGTMKWRVTTRMNNEDHDQAPILAYAWKDSGVVYLMSTCHRGGEVIVVERQSGAIEIEVPAPAMVEQYCIGMRGVDIADQLRSSYCIRQKAKRWYMSMFYWVVESAIVNAFACARYHDFSADFPWTKSHLSFRTSIIYSLLGYGMSVNDDRGVASDPPMRTRLDTLEQLPAVRVINALHLPVKRSKGRCQWCWLMKREQHRTLYKCRECHVNLCIECFAPFHDFRP